MKMNTTGVRFSWVVAALALIAAKAPASGAEPAPLPLHVEMDRLFESAWQIQQVTPAAASDDAEFVRRVHLDLIGMIPTAERVRQFLADSANDKREKLIDELLASPAYVLHMARVFDGMLIERRLPSVKSYDVPTKAWREFLAEAVADNRPWDQLVRQILASDGREGPHAAAVKFYLVRDVSPHQLTRDIGRLLLGVDLQCAQCHDDPRFEDYKQADYYGLYAFVGRLSLHRDEPKNRTLVAEKAEGGVDFTSVFTAKSGKTSPRLPGGEMLDDPPLVKGEEYEVKPGGGAAPLPKYSRRLRMSEQLPRDETPGFAQNLANRIWAQLLGRGLIHPWDLSHRGNSPSHPEVMHRLTQWLIEHDYDVRGLVREIVLTRVYQLSSLQHDSTNAPPASAFAVAPLRGLTAEQFRWSILQATGQVESRLATATTQPTGAAKDGKKNDAKDEATPVPAWRARFVALEPLERASEPIVTALAGLPGQSEGTFQPSVDQALFLRNNPKWIALWQGSGNTLLDRVASVEDAQQAAELAYLSILSRMPSSEETVEVKQLMPAGQATAERRTAAQSLLLGLLLSAEFRLNH